MDTLRLPPTHQALLGTLSRPANAWLLSGPAGSGKAALARYAVALDNCARLRSLHPCWACSSCHALLQGHHPDLLSLAPRSETASGKIARRKLIPVSAVLSSRDRSGDYEQHVYEFLEVRPTYRRRHVLIQGAEYLSPEAANALLKLMEEPPHSALFWLLAEDQSAVMPTLLSRSGRLRVPPVPDEELRALLPAQQRADGELLDFLAGRAGLIAQLPEVQGTLEQARAFTEAAQTDLWSALEAAAQLEKAYHPDFTAQALRFVWRDFSPLARVSADHALEALQEALEAYAQPALSFQVFALDLRAALRAGGPLL